MTNETERRSSGCLVFIAVAGIALTGAAVLVHRNQAVENTAVAEYFAAVRAGQALAYEAADLLVSPGEMDDARTLVREGHADVIEGVASVRSKTCVRATITGVSGAQQVWVVYLPAVRPTILGMSAKRDCRCHGRHQFDPCDFER